jgi:hypothetical protein
MLSYLLKVFNPFWSSCPICYTITNVFNCRFRAPEQGVRPKLTSREMGRQMALVGELVKSDGGWGVGEFGLQMVGGGSWGVGEAGSS